jgi:hypothetical protein
MAAMYTDLKHKESRSNNIIIAGMKQGNAPDMACVYNLLHAEFNWERDELEEAIVSCRRLGKPQQERVQPILVVCDTRSTADYFITHAKKLRSSHDSAVRENVFISADLTPSEAKAAYEMRCRRRGNVPSNNVSSSNLASQQYQHHHGSVSRTFIRSQNRDRSGSHTHTDTTDSSSRSDRTTSIDQASSECAPADKPTQMETSTDITDNQPSDANNSGRHC